MFFFRFNLWCQEKFENVWDMFADASFEPLYVDFEASSLTF